MVDLSRRLVPFFRWPDALDGAVRCGLEEALERLNAGPLRAGHFHSDDGTTVALPWLVWLSRLFFSSDSWWFFSISPIPKKDEDEPSIAVANLRAEK